MKATVISTVLTIAILFAAAHAAAGEVGFVEDYALARDRSVAMKQLIPGTEDYYYYHCLYYQQTQQLAQVDKMLESWIDRHGKTARVKEIEARQALLKYDTDARGSLDFLINRLDLRFDHQRQVPDKAADVPTALAPNRISDATFLADALGRDKSTVEGLNYDGLRLLNPAQLNGEQRRDLLRRLDWPDYPNLLKLILGDLDYKGSTGFSSFGIHKRLTLSQMDELLKLRPALLTEQNFVLTYLPKLRPSDDVNVRQDTAARKAYLDRQWEFVSRLAPSFNSLKACVLYHSLDLDRSQGTYDKNKFLAYLKLPRPCPYVPKAYLELDQNRNVQVNMTASFQEQAGLPPIGEDEGLVRDYLLHFLAEAKDASDFQQYVNDVYLKEALAEAKITGGIGDQEQWYSMLPATKYQSLKDRVDVELALTNKKLFAADEAVSLKLNVKNVPNLIVKIFEINALNYYRAKQQPVETDIDLEGLVATDEQNFKYDAPPLRRHSETFDFAALKKPGVYVMEFIGNGRSSRALIQKGTLRCQNRLSVAGQVLTVLDENNKLVADARAYLGAHEYTPDQDGRITLPFSTDKANGQTVVLARGNLAALCMLDRKTESYTLEAQFFLDRENLLQHRTAKLLIRPALLLSGQPVTTKLLEEVTLRITSKDIEGTKASREFRDVKLFDDHETVQEFQVPPNLYTLTFELRAKVQNVSQNKKEDLLATGDGEYRRGIMVNGIDKSAATEAIYLNRIGERYYLDVLGRTGEPRPDRLVSVALRHEAFTKEVQLKLKTDKSGRIDLGELKNIDRVAAVVGDRTVSTSMPYLSAELAKEAMQGYPRAAWFIKEDSHSSPGCVLGSTKRPVLIPYMGKSDKVSPEEFGLLELHGDAVVADRLGAMKIERGYLVIEGLPAGDYKLRMDHGREIAIALTDGPIQSGFAMGKYRQLEASDPHPFQIVALTADKDFVKVQTSGADASARVHLVATRFLPDGRLLSRLWTPDLGYYRSEAPESLYLSGRDIGDEYRYILDRRYVRKFPGNMLERPGLLLNPWALQESKAEDLSKQLEDFAHGYGGSGHGPRSSFAGNGGSAGAKIGAIYDFNFLPEQSVLLTNLTPNKDGVVTVKRADLGGHQFLQVLATDSRDWASRQLSLGEVKLVPTDLRLVAKQALDPKAHFAEQRQTTLLAKGQMITIADATSAKMMIYDSLPRVYGLYVTLSNSSTLGEFAFILRWPKMKPEEKRAKYSEFACHELDFFLSKKDPEFFEKVIQPYLRNKRDKTFMDHYLLGEDLSSYMRPLAYANLNTAEKVMLGQRLPGQQASIARFVQDKFDLVRPDVELMNSLFSTALGAGSLERAYDVSDLITRIPQVPGPVLDLSNTIKTEEDRRKHSDQGKAGPTVEGEDFSETPAGVVNPGDAGPDNADKEKEARAAARKRLQLELEARARIRQLYRALEPTQEYAENNYYHLPIAQQDASLVPAGAFWLDYAKRDPKAPFVSTHFAEAGRTFTEMMFALAVLDLPFDPPSHDMKAKEGGLTLQAGGTSVLFHKEIKPAQVPDKTPVLVTQNYFRLDDRYRYEGNEQFDKFVSDEFLSGVVYGCQVVVTNPTSTPMKLDLLLQVPQGAIAVSGGLLTLDVPIDLKSYSTQKQEYFFYFPFEGEFTHFGVHVARNETLLGFAPSANLKVVREPTKIDRSTWDFISQNGTSDEVLRFLSDVNLSRLVDAGQGGLERIAWRMKNKDFFLKTIDLLASRHAYSSTLWSYGLLHNHLPAMKDYLADRPDLVAQVGPWFQSAPLSVDPVGRKTYQHLEYKPLVNARAHKVGLQRTILNDKFYAQYMQFMKVLSCKPKLDNEDLLAVTYYLFLQDRVEEALVFLGQVDNSVKTDKEPKVEERLQLDYLLTYAAFYIEDAKTARQIASKYADYPVDRWRKLFVAALAQLDELEGKSPTIVDENDRLQLQTQLAATEPGLEVKVDGQKITVNYQNVTEFRMNYYLMDVELLFSKSPFVQQYSDQFSLVTPNQTQTIPTAKSGAAKPATPGKGSVTLDLPEKLRGSNVMVEAVAGAARASQACYANSLAVQVIESYGQVKVTDAAGKPLSKVYIKVYARNAAGEVKFHKDGYTDLRGRFDYYSVSQQKPEEVERLSILVLSEKNGAVVREAAPPKQ